MWGIEQGFSLVRVYADDGYSGGDWTRPEWNQSAKDAKRHKQRECFSLDWHHLANSPTNRQVYIPAHLLWWFMDDREPIRNRKGQHCGYKGAMYSYLDNDSFREPRGDEQ